MPIFWEQSNYLLYIEAEDGLGPEKFAPDSYTRSAVVGTKRVLVLDHLLGFIADGVVDLLERLFSGEQVVVVEELSPLLRETVELPGVALSALVVVQGDLLHDALIDQLLDVLVDSGVTHAGVELLEFVHRRKLLGVLEDVVDQGKPRLLSDEVDEFAGFHPAGSPQVGAHMRRYTAWRRVVYP